MNESLNSVPGEVEVYSDLSFITLQMVVGAIAVNEGLVSANDFIPQCTNALKNRNDETDVTSIVCGFEAFVRKEVFQRVADDNKPWLKNSSYLPAKDLYPLCAPTMDDTGE